WPQEQHELLLRSNMVIGKPWATKEVLTPWTEGTVGIMGFFLALFVSSVYNSEYGSRYGFVSSSSITRKQARSYGSITPSPVSQIRRLQCQARLEERGTGRASEDTS